MFQKLLHAIPRSFERIRGLRGWGRLSSFCMFTETFVRVKRAKSHRLFSQARRFRKRGLAKNIMFHAWIEIKSYGVRLNNPFWKRRAMKIAHQAYKSFRWTYDFKSRVQTSRMSLRTVMETTLKQEAATECLERSFRWTLNSTVLRLWRKSRGVRF